MKLLNDVGIKFSSITFCEVQRDHIITTHGDLMDSELSPNPVLYPIPKSQFMISHSSTASGECSRNWKPEMIQCNVSNRIWIKTILRKRPKFHKGQIKMPSQFRIRTHGMK